ncbi:MAG: hypothetical protein KKC21_02475 [Nitrospinae bacterium]|nr:hypothetical protein [Nitrospinota bacterium]
MGKKVVKKKTTGTSGKEKKDKKRAGSVKPKEAKKENTSPNSKEIQAILVFSLRPLDTPKKLLQQISEQQRSDGHTIGPKCVTGSGLAMQHF